MGRATAARLASGCAACVPEGPCLIRLLRNPTQPWHLVVSLLSGWRRCSKPCCMGTQAMADQLAQRLAAATAPAAVRTADKGCQCDLAAHAPSARPPERGHSAPRGEANAMLAPEAARQAGAEAPGAGPARTTPAALLQARDGGQGAGEADDDGASSVRSHDAPGAPVRHFGMRLRVFEWGFGFA
jgi:hypothetical protein